MLSGSAPKNFTNGKGWSRLANAYPARDGSSPAIFYSSIFENWPKINVYFGLISLGFIGGIAPIFSTWCVLVIKSIKYTFLHHIYNISNVLVCAQKFPFLNLGVIRSKILEPKSFHFNGCQYADEDLGTVSVPAINTDKDTPLLITGDKTMHTIYHHSFHREWQSCVQQSQGWHGEWWLDVSFHSSHHRCRNITFNTSASLIIKQISK